MRALLLVLLFVAGCSEPDGAKAILKAQGYTQIRMTGHEFFVCGQNDTFTDTFIAKPPSSKRPLPGIVCCGVMKGCTVRFR